MSQLLTEGLLHNFFWGGLEVSLTLTRIGFKQRALRFMEKQGHHAKAGIQAVTVVCLILHDSDSFSFSIFGSIPTTFQRLGERKSPLLGRCSMFAEWN